MTTHELSPDARSPRKATLFCPDCEFQGSLDGDWTMADAEPPMELRCPECGATIPVGWSPRDDRDDSERISAVPIELLERNLRTWQRFQRRISGD